MGTEKDKSVIPSKVIIVIVFIAFIASAVGFILNKTKNTGVSKSIKGTESIILDLWLHEVASTKSDLFKNGEYTNLIVRNRPHGKLQIQDAQCAPLSTKEFFARRYSIPTEEYKDGFFKEPYLWQCRLTLLDNEALTTSNGYLSHGNHLKIGKRIALEGIEYRVDGYIVNIKAKEDTR